MATHYTCALRIFSYSSFVSGFSAFGTGAGFGAAGFLEASFFFGESWIVIRFPSSTGIWSTFA